MNCPTCGKYVNTLSKRRHRCKKPKPVVEDKTDQLKIKLAGSYVDQTLYWWNWRNSK